MSNRPRLRPGILRRTSDRPELPPQGPAPASYRKLLRQVTLEALAVDVIVERPTGPDGQPTPEEQAAAAAWAEAIEGAFRAQYDAPDATGRLVFDDRARLLYALRPADGNSLFDVLTVMGVWLLRLPRPVGVRLRPEVTGLGLLPTPTGPTRTAIRINRRRQIIIDLKVGETIDDGHLWPADRFLDLSGLVGDRPVPPEAS